MKHLTIAPFPGAHLRAAQNRERVAADFRSPGLSIAVWLGVCAALGIAGMAAWTQLLAAEAALKCAASV